MQPVVAQLDGGALVVGTHDEQCATDAVNADRATCEEIPDREDRGDPIRWRREWLENGDDVAGMDYRDRFPVDPGTSGALPALILE